MTAHTLNPSPREAEAVSVHPGLYSAFLGSPGLHKKPCLEKVKNKTNKIQSFKDRKAEADRSQPSLQEFHNSYMTESLSQTETNKGQQWRHTFVCFCDVCTVYFSVFSLHTLGWSFLTFLSLFFFLCFWIGKRYNIITLASGELWHLDLTLII